MLAGDEADSMYLAKLPSSSTAVPLDAGAWEEYYGVVRGSWNDNPLIAVTEVRDANWGCMDSAAANFSPDATADDTSCKADLEAAVVAVELTGIGDPFYFKLQPTLVNNRPHYTTGGGTFHVYWTQRADGGAFHGSSRGSEGGWVLDDDSDASEYRAFIHTNSLAVPLGDGGWKEGRDYSPAAVTVVDDAEWGCTDPAAENFSRDATADDESCAADLDAQPRMVCLTASLKSPDGETENLDAGDYLCMELQPDLLNNRAQYVWEGRLLRYSALQRAWVFAETDGQVVAHASSASVSMPSKAFTLDVDQPIPDDCDGLETCEKLKAGWVLVMHVLDNVGDAGVAEPWPWQQACLDIFMCSQQDLEQASAASSDRQMRDLLPRTLAQGSSDGLESWSSTCIACLNKAIEHDEPTGPDCKSALCGQIAGCLDTTVCDTSYLSDDILDTPTNAEQIGVRVMLMKSCPDELLVCLTTRGCEDELDDAVAAGSSDDPSPEMEALIVCKDGSASGGTDWVGDSFGEILVRSLADKKSSHLSEPAIC